MPNRRGYRPTGLDPGGNFPDPRDNAPTAATPAVPEPLLDIGIPGLPPEVATAVDKILRDGAPNAEQRALAYLRTTDWYKTQYRGIGAGVAKGIIGGEVDYRGYVNQLQGLFQRYYGRAATGDDIEYWLNQGFTPDTIGRKFEGAAYVAANRADLQWASGAFGEGQLTEVELSGLGEQEAGLGSAIGVKIKTSVQKALERAERVFQGQVATSPLALESLSETQQRRKKPDVAA